MFIVLVAFIAIVLGLVKPKLVIRWGDEDKRTRGKVLKTYVTLLVVSFVLFGVTIDKNSDKQASSDNTVVNTEQKSDKSAKEKKVEKEEKVVWNTKEADSTKNGNVRIAVKELKKNKDLKSISIDGNPAEIIKRPWDFYGKAIKFTGSIAVIEEFPPDSDESKAMGGKAYDIVIVSADQTIVEGFMEGSSGNLKKGDQVTIYGYPTGTMEVANRVGGKFTHLEIVGNR